MRWYRNKGTGKEQLWLEEEEFETIPEDELRAAALYPTADQPIVDIERFIQRHMKADLDQHADLGDEIAGAIEFGSDRMKILISRQLTEMADEFDCPPGVRGRWRATMAHEAVHGLLHRRVFETSPTQQSLFTMPEEEMATSPQIIECSKSDITFDLGSYDWREYQANRGMASLLMPRKLFITLAREEAGRLSSQEQPVRAHSREYNILVRRLSSCFEVSQRATEIRLKALETAAGIGQRSLIAS